MNWLKLGNKISLMSFIGILFVAIPCSILIFFQYPLTGTSSILPNSLGIILLIIIVLKLSPKKETKTFILYSFLPLIPFGIWLYIDSTFGSFDWTAILFHLRAGFDDSRAVSVYYNTGMVFIVSFVFLAIGMLILKNSSKAFKYIDVVAAVALLVFNPALVIPPFLMGLACRITQPFSVS